MFIITLTYKQPLEVVEQYLVAHRTFLEEGYVNNYFVASGPQNPRTGGIIIACLRDKKILADLLQRDPFYIHGIADYQIAEFIPVKFHKNFEYFLNLPQ